MAEGAAERIGLAGGYFWMHGAHNETIADIQDDFPDHRAAVRTAFSVLERIALPSPAAVGHRIVHGGAQFTEPVIIDALILNKLRGLVSFAPLHMPAEIRCIEAVAERFPKLPQAACFDTAFHRRMPELTKRFPLPRKLWNEGVQRYGFHGLSDEYIMQTVKTETKSRIIIAHLGNGASLSAVKDGRPLDTTMGFTPAGGFMMGTRCGDIDPGVLLYLMENKGYDVTQIDDLVNRRSGLLGVSGISPDMKMLLENSASAPNAKLAVDMFCYQLVKHIGALAAALGGLDLLVFTGGIGERAAAVRKQVCQNLRFLGIRLDNEHNKIHAEIISMPDSPCKVMVIPTNEDLMIARHTYKLIC